jgi:hypothetical protein
LGQRDSDIDERFAARAKDVRAELDRLLGEARRRAQQARPQHPLRRPAVVVAVAAAFVAGVAFAVLRARTSRRRGVARVARLRGVPSAVSRALAS